ncbi:WG repeat-containing protein [Chamaesiphon sp. OTE_75_metabat_556]|uniref:WG repeat-containing protein n=1 Tax=Chamaesiphon sp. OTE_75_metabat_556 TaxID=2964692 RepID=UPI00286AB563|nr:WG repeat-containing protein [Chamaesiphon sp. OTE_75_metabat_556]
MKLKFDRLIILSFLAILSLSSCSRPAAVMQQASTPNLPTTSLSPSPNSERFLFWRKGKLGYIDRTGKIVIPAKFDRAYDFSEGLAGVGIGERYGYIDTTGKFAISPHVGFPSEFKNGFANVIIGNKTHKIDRTGKLVTTSLPAPASETNQGESDKSIAFAQNNKYGYKDRNNKIVVPAQFDRVAPRFVEGMAWVQINDLVGYINDLGQTIVSPQFDNFSDFDRGWARVCKASKCGYIDKIGKIVIPLKFDEAAAKFSNGLAWVSIGKNLGYIDRTGKLVVPARYDTPNHQERKRKVEEGHISKCNADRCFDVSPNFDRGLAMVVIPSNCKSTSQACDRLGYIDTTGKLVFEF